MKKTGLFLILIASVFLLNAQYDSNFKNKYFQAENMIEYGNYEDALLVYLELLQEVPDNYNINFKVGYCYLNTVLDKKKSIPYLEKAMSGVSNDYQENDYKTTSCPLEVYYYLGEAYHLDYKFQDAIDILENLKTQVPDIEFRPQIDSKIQQCKNGIELMKYPVKMIVTNLGGGINSEYKEHSPVFSADESVLIYTSRREGNKGELMSDGQYSEDIYVANKNKDGLWSNPKSIGESINTEGNEASIGLSVDGQKLLIYKDDNEDGNIYYSELSGETWSKPVKLGPTINTKANENHASISADGNTLYFDSDRKEGYGGYDIYIVKKLPNGEWSEAMNLGPEINTSLNERSPFIHPDNVTLFFSSQSHFNMGGFDIFFSILDENQKWQEPTNMGYPINTTDDDLFYTPTPDGKRAYYASQQTGGIGATDIYMITLPGSEEKALTVMSGIVKLSNGQQPESVYIEVTDNDNGELVGSYTPNSKTGKYLFILTPGRTYKVLCEADGFTPYEEIFTVPENSSYQQIQRAINLSPIVFAVNDGGNDDKNSTLADTSKSITQPVDTVKNVTENVVKVDDNKVNDVVVENKTTDFGPELVISPLLFDFDKHQTSEYYETMNKLAVYLVKNPEAMVEIQGHTDAQGDETYNILLSKNRANFVKNYLIGKGAKESNFSVKGFGEIQPVAIDISPASRKYNRRVEFKILKAGNAVLKVETLSVPEQYKIK